MVIQSHIMMYISLGTILWDNLESGIAKYGSNLGMGILVLYLLSNDLEACLLDRYTNRKAQTTNFKMNLAELVHKQAFWCRGEEERGDHNWIYQRYWYRTNCTLYIYAIMCWGTKIISGRSSRKLVIKDKEMAQPDHISWLIGNLLGGNIIYIWCMDTSFWGPNMQFSS